MEHIRELREERGMSQKQLAEALDIHRTAVAKYEAGENGAKAEILNRLADIFNVSTDYLLGRTDEKRPASAEAGAWVLTAEEAALLADYRALNAEGKASVANTAHGLVLSGAYKKEADSAGRVQAG